MTGLRFRWEWEDALAVQGLELRATWARLKIEINGETVTHVHDQRTNAVRDAIYGPLYPIAEWLLSGWWPLLYEAGDEANVSSGFTTRHSLTFADEGYAIPDLRIVPAGNMMQVSWQSRRPSGQRVAFLSAGFAILDRAQVEAALEELIQSVVNRLVDQQVKDTFLETEWSARQQSDPHEQEFCRAAGSMGLDPLSLSAATDQDILSAAQRLPAELQAEFFSSALPNDLQARCAWVQNTAADLTRRASVPNDLARLRNVVLRRFTTTGRPWDDGYYFARLLREELGVGLNRIDPRIIGGVEFDREVIWDQSPPARIEGLLTVNDQNSAAFCLAKKHRPDSRRFMFCRALGEFLAGDGNGSPHSALLTTAATANQKRNRAFAAEFLVPADAIRSRLTDDHIDDEAIDDLSDEFLVSSHVVRHQLRNHNLMPTHTHSEPIAQRLQ